VNIDPEQARKLLRFYRGAKMAQSGVGGLRKVRRMLDDHAEQTDFLMDAEELVTRVRERRVRSEDVHAGARAVVRAAPRVYIYIARHVRENREGNDA
jgi:hypothetical protein